MKRELLCDDEPALKLWQEDDSEAAAIWIDVTPEDDHSGVCVGVGTNRAAAYADALMTLARFAGDLRSRLAALGQGVGKTP